MRYLHTLNVHYVLVHVVHYALQQSKQNNLTNPVTNNRVAICKIKLAAPYRGQAEYQLCRLNTSEESRALKSCGPGIFICYGLTVYSVADVCRLADVQPSRKESD